MVSDYHEVTNVERCIGTTSGIAYKECLDAQLVHYSDGECHFLHRVTLIIVETSLHGHHFFASKSTKDEFAVMTFHRGNGEIRDICIAYLFCYAYLISHFSQTRT